MAEATEARLLEDVKLLTAENAALRKALDEAKMELRKAKEA